MSPLSGTISKILHRKGQESHAPQKALYLDLESAYEGITRKASESTSSAPSSSHSPHAQACLSSGGSTEPQPMLLPSSSEQPPRHSLRVAKSSRTFSNRAHEPGQAQVCRTIPSGHLTGPLIDASMVFTDLAAHDKRSESTASGDEASFWQTVITESGSDMNQEPASMDISSAFNRPRGAAAKHRQLQSRISLDQFAWSPVSSDCGDGEAGEPDSSQTPPSANESTSTREASSLNDSGSASSPGELFAEYRDDSQFAWHASKDSYSSREHGSMEPLSGLARPTSSFISFESPVQNSGQLSGIISDGMSSRPMSQTELEESLSIFIQSAMSASTASCQTHESRSPSARLRVTGDGAEAGWASRHDEVWETNLSGGLNKNSSAQPLVSSSAQYSSHAFVPSTLKHSEAIERFTLGACNQTLLTRTNSRLARAAAAAGVKDTGRLGRAMAHSSDSNWATEAALTDLAGERPSSCVNESSAGDQPDKSANADTNSLSSNRTQICQSDGCHLDPLKTHPRYNQSWSLVRNLRTGSIALVPKYTSRNGTRRPNVALKSLDCESEVPLSSTIYRNPRPLPQHIHPVNTSPRMTPSSIQPREISAEQSHTKIHGNLQKGNDESDGSMESSGNTGSSQHGDMDALNGDSFATPMLVRGDQSPYLPRQRRPTSSTWLSTVSENESDGQLGTARINSFAKQTILGQKGNLTGTPEGTGARELGSSLAGYTSPGSNPRSSLVDSMRSSPSRYSSPELNAAFGQHETVTAVKEFHRELEGLGTPSRLAHNPASFLKRRRFGKQAYDQNLAILQRQKGKARQPRAFVDCSRRLSLTRSSPPDGKGFIQWRERRARESTIVDSTGSCGSNQIVWQDYLPALGQRRNFVARRENRRGSAATEVVHGAASSGAYPASSSQPKSGHLVATPETQDRVVKIETRAAEHRESSLHGIPNLRAEAGTHKLTGLNEGLASTTPRLYDTIGHHSTRTEAQQVLFSRLWALACLLFPFLGPIFGHGYMDKIMAWHSNGTVTEFRRHEKIAVLFYSYIVFGLILAGLALAMVIKSR